MNNVLNASRDYLIMKKAKLNWKLNQEFSTRYQLNAKLSPDLIHYFLLHRDNYH